jgi:hypothetical protein
MEAIGGLYVDEATGKVIQMGNVMFRAATDSVSGNSSVAITPLTEMAVQYMNGTYSNQMMTTANQLMEQTFGVNNIISTMPHNVSMPASSGQSNETYYGLMLAAMSQMAASSNSTISLIMQEMVNAMAANNTQQLNGMLSMMNQAFTTFSMGPQNMTGTTPSPSGMMGNGGMMGGNNGNTTGPGSPETGGGMM